MPVVPFSCFVHWFVECLPLEILCALLMLHARCAFLVFRALVWVCGVFTT